jgi:carnitine O-acetyltransferase
MLTVGLNTVKGGTPPVDTTPKRLEWRLSPELRAGARFAETCLSNLICQNDCQALEFKGYGRNFITSHGFSPDAFVQMAFQAAYFEMYGTFGSVFEPAMTKTFSHGRLEVIRSTQVESVGFVKVSFATVRLSFHRVRCVLSLYKISRNRIKLRILPNFSRMAGNLAGSVKKSRIAQQATAGHST